VKINNLRADPDYRAFESDQLDETDGDGSSPLGITEPSLVNQVSGVFVEACRDAVVEGGMSLDQILAYTAAHEIGHQLHRSVLGLDEHDAGGLMSSSHSHWDPLEEYRFAESSIHWFRMRLVSPGSDVLDYSW